MCVSPLRPCPLLVARRELTRVSSRSLSACATGGPSWPAVPSPSTVSPRCRVPCSRVSLSPFSPSLFLLLVQDPPLTQSFNRTRSTSTSSRTRTRTLLPRPPPRRTKRLSRSLSASRRSGGGGAPDGRWTRCCRHGKQVVRLGASVCGCARGCEGERARRSEPRRCRRAGRERALAFARRSAAPSRFSSASRRSCSRARLGARRRARRSLVALARRGRHCSRRSPASALAPLHRSLLPLVPARRMHSAIACGSAILKPARHTGPPSELSRAPRAARQPFARSFVFLSLPPMLFVTLQPSRSDRAWLRREQDGLTAVQRSHGPLALQLQLELFFSSPGCTPRSCACALRRATAAASAGRAYVVDERQELEMRTSGRSERPPRSSRSRSSRQHRRSPARCARCDARSAARDARTRAEALSALVLSGRTRTKRGRRHCRTALDS